MEIDPLPRYEAEQIVAFLAKEGVRAEAAAASSFVPIEGQEGQKATETGKMGKEELVWFVRAIQDIFQGFNLGITFRVHEETKRIIARVINRQTGELIREIPLEKFLDMIARLQELAGIFIDEVV